MKKILLILVTIVLSSLCFAQWSTDSTVNNTVNAQTGQQNIHNAALYQHCLATDGAGGVIVVWQDTRNNAAIYTQRVDNNGNLKWDAAGISVATLASNTWNVLNPSITSDGKGGAIMIWQRNVSGYGDSLFAQRVDASGNVKWTVNGVSICTNGNTNQYPVICSDNNGGAFISWVDNRSGNNQLYEQSISNSGTVNWLSNGITVSKFSFGTGPSAQQIISGGSNNSILVWGDTRNSGATNLYAQGVSSIGALPVELVSFTASSTKNSVELKWKTATELNNYGFDVERSALSSMPSAKSIAQRVPQAGSYSVQLSEASVQLTSGVSVKGEYASGVYFYRLQAGNFSSVKKLILIK